MTLSEFKEWQLLPQTSEFFEYLKLRKEVVKEEWAEALYVGDVGEETLQRNAAALGEVKLLKEILSLDHATLEEMILEYKHIGN